MEQTRLNFAICDDNPDQLTYLTELLNEWSSQTGLTINVTPFGSAEEFLFEYDDKKYFDILLLDVEMPGMDGLTLARKIRQSDDGLQIIFVTGYDQYIADGYDVAAFHYLIKPVKKEKLFEVITKAALLIKHRDKHIFLNANRTTVKVALQSIIYIEASQNYVDVYTTTDTYHVKMSLTAIEDLLDESFFRTGKSFIVGLRYVKSISKAEVTLDNGTLIPLGRGLYEAANKAFINFY